MRSLSITPALALAAALLLSTPLDGKAQVNQGLVPCSSGTPTSLSASGSSSNTQLIANCGVNVILYNVGSQEAFYKIGTSVAVAAATTDNSLPAGAFVLLSLTPNQRWIAAITSTSTTTIRLVQGTVR